jgi:hypothetical protein
VVANRKAAKWKLGDMLMYLHEHRSALEAYRNEGDAAGVERWEQILKLDYAGIRKHCAEHDLELPHDVSDEGA